MKKAVQNATPADIPSASFGTICSMDKFFQTLKEVMAEIEGTDFAVLGTYNLYLQGVNIEPHDLDIIADDEGIFLAGAIYGSEVKRNYQGYYETEFTIDETEVHFVSNQNNEIRPPFRENTTWIEKDGLRIPCLSLVAEEAFYIYKDREKDKGKVELIRERMRV